MNRAQLQLRKRRLQLSRENRQGTSRDCGELKKLGPETRGHAEMKNYGMGWVENC